MIFRTPPEDQWEPLFADGETMRPWVRHIRHVLREYTPTPDRRMWVPTARLLQTVAGAMDPVPPNEAFGMAIRLIYPNCPSAHRRLHSHGKRTRAKGYAHLDGPLAIRAKVAGRPLGIPNQPDNTPIDPIDSDLEEIHRLFLDNGESGGTL